ncbi:MAG: hypothetical protein IT497_08775 [Ottowia sp.]|nr:hypothetical protein [Ottowia sp.]
MSLPTAIFQVTICERIDLRISTSIYGQVICQPLTSLCSESIVKTDCQIENQKYVFFMENDNLVPKNQQQKYTFQSRKSLNIH